MQIEVWPCLTGCHINNFAVPGVGNREVSPINPFNSVFPVYTTFMAPFLHSYALHMHYVTTTTDYESYERPTFSFLGMPFEFQYSLAQQQITTLSFDFINIKTTEGHLSRSVVRSKKALSFNSASYKSKARKPTDRLQLIIFEMNENMILVERVYPNLIDLWSDIGSVL